MPAHLLSLPQLLSFASQGHLLPAKQELLARPRLPPLSPPAEPADQLTQLMPCGIQFSRIPSWGWKNSLEETSPLSRIQKVGHSCFYPAEAPKQGQNMLCLGRRDEKQHESTSRSGSVFTPHVLMFRVWLTSQCLQGARRHFKHGPTP